MEKVINSDQKEGAGGRLRFRLRIKSQFINLVWFNQKIKRLCFELCPARKNRLEEIKPCVKAISKNVDSPML